MTPLSIPRREILACFWYHVSSAPKRIAAAAAIVLAPFASAQAPEELIGIAEGEYAKFTPQQVVAAGGGGAGGETAYGFFSQDALAVDPVTTDQAVAASGAGFRQTWLPKKRFSQGLQTGPFHTAYEGELAITLAASQTVVLAVSTVHTFADNRTLTTIHTERFRINAQDSLTLPLTAYSSITDLMTGTVTADDGQPLVIDDALLAAPVDISITAEITLEQNSVRRSGTIKALSANRQKVTFWQLSRVSVSESPALSDADPKAISTAAAGTADKVSRSDHVHPSTGLATLSDKTPQPTGKAAAGTGTAASRDDHVHQAGSSGGGAPVGDADPKALAASASAGSSGSASRQDHVHPQTGMATDAELTPVKADATAALTKANEAGVEIDQLTPKVTANTTGRATNATGIATNKTDIATNKTDIATNKTAIAAVRQVPDPAHRADDDVLTVKSGAYSWQPGGGGDGGGGGGEWTLLGTGKVPAGANDTQDVTNIKYAAGNTGGTCLDLQQATVRPEWRVMFDQATSDHFAASPAYLGTNIGNPGDTDQSWLLGISTLTSLEGFTNWAATLTVLMLCESARTVIGLNATARYTVLSGGVPFRIEYRLPGGGGGGSATPLSDGLPKADGTASAGTGTAASRGDHVHPLAAIPQASNDSPEHVKTGSGEAGESSRFSRADHAHSIPTALYGTATKPVGTASAGSATTLARSDHVHGAGGGGVTLSNSLPSPGGRGSPGSAGNASRGDHVHPQDEGWITWIRQAETVIALEDFWTANFTVSAPPPANLAALLRGQNAQVRALLYNSAGMVIAECSLANDGNNGVYGFDRQNSPPDSANSTNTCTGGAASEISEFVYQAAPSGNEQEQGVLIAFSANRGGQTYTVVLEAFVDDGSSELLWTHTASATDWSNGVPTASGVAPKIFAALSAASGRYDRFEAEVRQRVTGSPNRVHYGLLTFGARRGGGALGGDAHTLYAIAFWRGAALHASITLPQGNNVGTAQSTFTINNCAICQGGEMITVNLYGVH